MNLLTGVMTDQTVTFGNTLIVKGSSANALSVGVSGTTNPAFNVVTNVASAITGLQVTGQVSGSGVLMAATGSANESMLLQGVGTGIVQTTATTASATVGAFKAINSNASAVGMSIMLSNLSANNAANAAELGFSMNNSTPAEKQFGAIRVTSSTVTAGAEGGTMILRTMQSGAMTTVLTLSSAGLTTAANGLTVTAGGAVVTAGGLQVTAGNVGVNVAPSSTNPITAQAIDTSHNAVFSLNATGNGFGAIAALTSKTAGGAQLTWSVGTNVTGSGNDIEVYDGTTTQARFYAAGGVGVGAPTGGSKGAGTINVSSNIYLNGTAYTNPHGGFEAAYTGNIVKYADRMKAMGMPNWTHLSMDAMEAYTREHMHFPGFADEDERGLFDGGERVLLMLEWLTVHCFGFDKRLRELEAA